MTLLRARPLRLISWFALLLLGACSHDGPSREVGGGGAAPGTSGNESAGPVDLSEVAPADGIAVAIRISDPREIAQSIEAMIGMEGTLRPAVDGLAREITKDAGIAALVDLSAGIDAVFVVDESGRDDVVVSLAIPPVPEAAARLHDARTLERRAGGIVEIGRTSAGQEAPHGPFCMLAPTADPAHGRVVCGEKLETVTIALPFLTRTLPLSPIPRGTMRADVLGALFRGPAGASIERELASVSERWSSTPETPSNPPSLLDQPGIRAAASRLILELVAVARAFVRDIDGVSFVVRADAEGLVLRFGGSMTNPSQPFWSALANALRQPLAASPDLLAFLPEDAAVYSAATIDLRGFQPWIDLATEVFRSVIDGASHLPRADADAVVQTVRRVMVARAVTTTTAYGFEEDGRPWSVQAIRLGTPEEARELVAAARGVFDTLQRPGVAAAIDGQLARVGPDAPRMREIRTLPARGLPEGAYAVRVPSIASIVQRLVRGNHAPAATSATPAAPPSTGRAATPARASSPDEWMIVPRGADVVIVSGADARALYARATATRSTAHVDSLLASNGAVGTFAFYPARVRVALGTGGPLSLASSMPAEVASSPITGHVTTSGEAPALRGAGEIHVDHAIVRGIVQAVMAGAASAVGTP